LSAVDKIHRSDNATSARYAQRTEFAKIGFWLNTFALKRDVTMVERRTLLTTAITFAAFVVSPLTAAAQVLRSSLQQVESSVGSFDRVQFDGQPGYRFTLRNQDGREREIAAEANGRQRIELRDTVPNGRGTLSYTLEFMVPPFTDPDGRLEEKFIFFQIKPDRVRNIGFIPYVSIMVPRNYRSEGFHVDFDFPNNVHLVTNSRLRVGAWHELQVIVRWTNGSDGYCDVLVDGRRIARNSGATGPDVSSAAIPSFGIYRSHMDRTDPQRVEDLTLYVKNYRVEQIG
jgi:hypothetical protein